MDVRDLKLTGREKFGIYVDELGRLFIQISTKGVFKVTILRPYQVLTKLKDDKESVKLKKLMKKNNHL